MIETTEVISLRKASQEEIAAFKREYCRNHESRIEIKNHFKGVEVEAFDELLPEKHISSYATGERSISDSFIMFHVYDDNVEYFPVFSESTGRAMLKAWNMAVPPKRSIFVTENLSSTRSSGGAGAGGKKQATASNIQMKTLILFSYSLMILHLNCPDPMDGVFKDLYQKFQDHPNYTPFACEIKAVNTALKHYLQNASCNTSNENFQNLQQYIEYLHSHIGGRRLRKTDFQQLRDIVEAESPAVQLYF